MNYIIKKKEIELIKGIAKTHYLNQNARRINKSLGDIVGLKNLGFHIIEVRPGFESTKYHSYSCEDECVYVLAGKATVTIDDVDREIAAGDFVGYPAGGSPHTMKNTGSEVLRCIVVGQRLTYDVGDYPRLGKRVFRYNGTNDLVNVVNIDQPSFGKKI